MGLAESPVFPEPPPDCPRLTDMNLIKLCRNQWDRNLAAPPLVASGFCRPSFVGWLAVERHRILHLSSRFPYDHLRRACLAWALDRPSLRPPGCRLTSGRLAEEWTRLRPPRRCPAVSQRSRCGHRSLSPIREESANPGDGPTVYSAGRPLRVIRSLMMAALGTAIPYSAGAAAMLPLPGTGRPIPSVVDDQPAGWRRSVLAGRDAWSPVAGFVPCSPAPPDAAPVSAPVRPPRL